MISKCFGSSASQRSADAIGTPFRRPARIAQSNRLQVNQLLRKTTAIAKFYVHFSHIVFAPSSSDNYASSSFSGLTDLLESVGNQTEAERPAEWIQIKQHLAVIAFYIEAAGRSLTDSSFTAR